TLERDHLPNLDLKPRSIGPLFGSSGAGDLFFDVLPLPVFPLAELIFVIGGNHKSGHQQAKEHEPGIELAQRSVHFLLWTSVLLGVKGFPGPLEPPVWSAKGGADDR